MLIIYNTCQLQVFLHVHKLWLSYRTANFWLWFRCVPIGGFPSCFVLAHGNFICFNCLLWVEFSVGLIYAPQWIMLHLMKRLDLFHRICLRFFRPKSIWIVHTCMVTTIVHFISWRIEAFLIILSVSIIVARMVLVWSEWLSIELLWDPPWPIMIVLTLIWVERWRLVEALLALLLFFIIIH